MKTKIHKILGVALALVLVFSLSAAFVPANQAEAQAYTPNQWNTLSTPSGSGKILMPGSSIADFAVGPDGATIYLINTGTAPGVYKSTNGGYSFSLLVLAPPDAKLVAVAPDNPDAVAVVAANNEVFVSSNAGAFWASLLIPAAGEVVSDIAVSPARAGTMLGRDYAVSTYDTKGFGDIYVVGTTAAWAPVATGAGVNLDFTSVALAPNWAGDRVVLGVGSGISAGGNNEQPGAAVGDSFLVAINVATGDLAGPQKVRLDAAASDSPAGFGFAHSGSYSVALDAGTQLGNSAGRIRVEVAAIPMADFTGASFFVWEPTDADHGGAFPNTDQIYPYGDPYINILIDMTGDGNFNEKLEGVGSITVGLPTSPTTHPTPTLNAWVQMEEGYGFYDMNNGLGQGTWTGPGGAGHPWQIGTLAEWKTWFAANHPTYKVVGVEITFGYWGILVDNLVYVDDVTINGVTYDLEGPTTTGVSLIPDSSDGTETYVEGLPVDVATSGVGVLGGPGTIVSSSIALPSDFEPTVGGFRAYVGWSSVKSAGGIILCSDDVYRVDFNSVRKLEVRPSVRVHSVSYFGTGGAGTLMAGESDTTNVWTSTDPGVAMPSWGVGSAKAPTGAEKCIVALTSATEALAGTSGANSGFHKTLDGGLSWNGLSFIDGATDYVIDDVMPSPDGSTVFMATRAAGNCSVWRGVGFPAPGSWQRVGFQTFTSSLIRLSPDYATDSTLYWFDTGSKTIKRSTDAGQMWSGRTAPEGVMVADAAIESQDILYIIDGTNVYTSTNGGWFFGLGTDVGMPLYDIAMAPSYPAKPVAGNILVGGAGVALSTDGAATFAPLLSGIPNASNLQVLADEDYASNNTVYAADNQAGSGIWRYNVGASSAWEQTDAVAGQMTGLAQCGGLLYGSWVAAGATAAGAVDADEFTITATGSVDSGSITVVIGRVKVTPSALATVGGQAAGTAVEITAGTPVAYTAANGDTLVVEALADNTNGIWAGTYAGAAITYDADTPDNAWVTSAPGVFSLPDKAVAAGEGGADASGVERTNCPTIPVIAQWEFQTMDVGAEACVFNAAPNALRVAGNGNSISLWTIDTGGSALMAYIDEMALFKPELTVPDTVPFDSVSGGNAEFAITWTWFSNTTHWKLQIYADPGCDEEVFAVAGFVAIFAPNYVVPAGTLVAGRDYFVKVKCTDQMPGDAIVSQKSSAQRFTVQAGERVTVSYLGVQPLGPIPGAIGVPLSPGFTWSPYAQSTRYEFQLASDAGFSDILAEAKVAVTGYKYDGTLANATTYFWRARGIEPTVTEWSPVASFTTEKKPVPPVVVEPTPLPEPAPPSAITPGVIWAIIAIGAILVIAVIVLIVRTRRTA